MDVPDRDWDDWRWQQAHRVTDGEALARVVRLTPEEREAIPRAARLFRMSITPYYASLIDPEDSRCPIRLQAVPRPAELEVGPHDREDPLAEEAHMVAPGLTHRYPDRALWYLTHHCPVYCRFCTRKRKVSDPASAPDRAATEAVLAYLRAHHEVRDVLLSGGDPLSLSDRRIAEVLRALRAIPHVEVVRLCTRNPVTLPQRITPELCAMLRRWHPIYVHVHFNHVRECTPEAARALDLLADAGCNLGNQMVLLRGVNEDPAMVRELNRWLVRHRCRPYYIHQCDLARGVSHFRAPIASGLRILSALRGWTSGMAVPDYVVDLPGGGGKVELVPDPVVRREAGLVHLRSYDGRVFCYPDDLARVGPA